MIKQTSDNLKYSQHFLIFIEKYYQLCKNIIFLLYKYCRLGFLYYVVVNFAARLPKYN